MKLWFENEAFWLRFGPVLFNSSRWARASEEAEQASALLDLPGDAYILDACCGVGRHSVEFARMGYKVTGVDLMPGYLEAAQETAEAESLPVDFIQADMREFVYPGFFSGAVILDSSLGYSDDPDDDRKILVNIHRSLDEDGKVLLELTGKETLSRNFPGNEWYEDSDGSLVLSEHRIIDDWDRLESRWILIRDDGRFEHTFSRKLYSATEVKALLHSAEFHDIHILGDFSGRPYDEKSEMILAVGHR